MISFFDTHLLTIQYIPIDKLIHSLSNLISISIHYIVYLGAAKQVLGMHIFHDREIKKLWLSQEGYIEKVLQRFSMDKVKPVSSLLANHFMMSSQQCPSTDVKKEEMRHTPY